MRHRATGKGWEQDNSRRMGIILVLAGGICWGFIGIFVQSIGPAIDPITLSIMRLGLASIIMLPVIVFHSGVKALAISSKQLAFFALFGFGYWTIYQILYFSSIQLVSAATAVVLLYTAPFFIIILAKLFLGEEITRRKVIAAVLGIVGISIMFGVWAINPARGMMLGGLMALGSGFCYATYYIYVKKALVNTDPVVTSFYSMLFGFLFLLLAAMSLFRERIVFEPSLTTLLLVLGLAGISTTLGVTLNVLGMKRIEAGEAGILALIEPITTLTVSRLLFGSSLTGWQMAGAALILAGAYMIYKRSEPEREQSRNS